MSLLDIIVRLIISRDPAFRAGYHFADQLRTELKLECAIVYVRETERIVALVVLNDLRAGGRIMDIRKTLMRRVDYHKPEDGLPLLLVYEAF